MTKLFLKILVTTSLMLLQQNSGFAQSIGTIFKATNCLKLTSQHGEVVYGDIRAKIISADEAEVLMDWIDDSKVFTQNNSLVREMEIPDYVSYKNNVYWVTSIGRGTGENSLHSITIPWRVENIGDSAFYNSKIKQSFKFKDDITNLKTIGKHAFSMSFQNGSNAHPDPVPNIFWEGIEEIGDSAFIRCSALNNVKLPKIKKLGVAAFALCFDNILQKDSAMLQLGDQLEEIPASLCVSEQGLKSIIIPNNVVSIGEKAFYTAQDTGRKKIVIGASVEYIGIRGLHSRSVPDSIFVYPTTPPVVDNFGVTIGSNTVVSVPLGTKNAYRQANFWKDYISNIQEVDFRTEQSLELAELPVKTYGDGTYTLPATTVEGQPLTWSSSNSDVAIVNENVLSINGAGTATITATQEGNGIYMPFNKGYSFTVNKAELTITAKSYSKQQGEAMPTFAATFLGFKNNETESVLTKLPTFTCSATATSEPGSYNIGVGGATALNYNITYVNGVLTVTPASPVIITANNYTRLYGDANPDFNYTSEGAILNGTPEITCSATATSPVGTYPITIGKGSVQNFNDTYVAGTLTILPAPLTITANDMVMIQGDDIPEFTASCSGFKNDETEEVFTSQPEFSCLATPESEIGSYDIVVSGASASNYDIQYVNGTLTIKQDDKDTDISQKDNLIYIENFEAKVGTRMNLSIKMKNSASIRGFQFDLYLPDGVVVAKNNKGKILASLTPNRLEEDDEHTLSVAEQPDGAVRFLCGSLYDESFIGNDGEIATLTIDVSNDMEDGDYALVMKSMKLSETDISKYYETPYVKSTMTVTSYVLGDVTGEGSVDVSDYLGVANFILGSTPEGFIERAGDVDESGSIDVSDYLGIANIILSGSIFGNSPSMTNLFAPYSLQKAPAETDISSIDNVIYINPVVATAGTQMEISINMKNSVPIRGFQFDLYLPEGVSALKNNKGKIITSLSTTRLEEGDEHTLSAAEQTDGAIRFLCGSLYDENFIGNDGEIAKILVNVSSDLENGVYPISLKNIKLSETDISKYYVTELVETTITVGDQGDSRVLLDENSVTAPKASDGAVDVRVKRTLTAGSWNTICLPFAMTGQQVADAFGNDVELADFSDWETEEDAVGNVVAIKISFENVIALDGMEANHPYLIKVSQPMTEFTVDGVVIAPEDEPLTMVKHGTKKRDPESYMIGTYAAETILDEYMLFISGSKFWYSAGQTKMKAFRAYFNIYDILTNVEESEAKISFNFDEISSVGTDDSWQQQFSGSVYDISGRKIGNGVSAIDKLSKGIYIVNGKKIIVK